jgi:predicted NBD/HSP70 family sugar kinase
MATATYLRDLNEQKVIRAMMRLRVASRSALAREAALSKPTIGRIVDALLERSIFAEAAAGSDHPRQARVEVTLSTLGRPSQRLELDGKRRRFLCIQVGVNEARLSALPIAVSRLDEWQVVFPTPSSAAALEAALRDAVAQLPAHRAEACVVSLPGVVDERAGRVLFSPNLHWTERVDFRGLVGSISPAPAIFIQEIRALALGQLAAEPRAEDFLLVDSGSGVGAAAVVGGKLYRAALPLNGELGHTPVVGNDRPCSCGSTGCVETLVSRGGLVASSREHGGPDAWAALVYHLREGNLPSWLMESLDVVAATVAGGLNLLGVRQVLLTGALAEIPGAVGYLSAAIRRGAMWSRFGEIRCRPTPRLRMLGMVSLAIDNIILGSDGRPSGSLHFGASRE